MSNIGTESSKIDTKLLSGLVAEVLFAVIAEALFGRSIQIWHAWFAP